VIAGEIIHLHVDFMRKKSEMGDVPLTVAMFLFIYLGYPGMIFQLTNMFLDGLE
jgi:hypothetical protein